MPIATEKIVPGVPKLVDKDIIVERYRSDSEFSLVSVLDSFDPSDIPPYHLQELAKRNPLITWSPEDEEELDYYPRAVLPVRRRVRYADFKMKREREEFLEVEAQLKKTVLCSDELNVLIITRLFKKMREVLVSLIGIKAALFVVELEMREYSEEELDAQDEDYREYEEELASRPIRTYYEYYTRDKLEFLSGRARVIGKLKAVRKALKFNQRDFAKFIGYPVNKYPLCEKEELTEKDIKVLGSAYDPDVHYGIDKFMLEKVVLIVHADPEWLLDDWSTVEDYLPEEYFCKAKEISEWVKAGKPGL